MRQSIDFVTIATEGNAQDFGDMYTGAAYNNGATSSTRAVYAGSSVAPYKYMEYITMATGGNSTFFGELENANGWRIGTSDTIRGVFAGGQSPATTNTIEYISIATLGDAVDFGDSTTQFHRSGGACSNRHGGLG